MLDTPVLLLVFNRPQKTQQVFDQIRKARPKKLFIGADGPRLDVKGDQQKCATVRELVTHVDWDCEVKTLFREENIGCGKAPYLAVTWFFDHVSEGIILEDDCLPSNSFFSFCTEMLKTYRTNKKVYHISGNSWLPNSEKLKGDYYFHSQIGMWGWATWSDRWQQYKFDIREDASLIRNKIRARFKSKGIRTYHYEHIEMICKTDDWHYWDYQWEYAVFLNDAVALSPKYNLVSNIGFSEDATHTNYFDERLAERTTYDFDFKNPIHPQNISFSIKIDEEIYGYLNIYTPSLLFRLKRKLKSFLFLAKKK